jgi:hydroxymethylbilane synthase
MSTSSPRIRIGTRSSPLALWQANWVAGQLRQRGCEVELIHVTTQGDVTAGPLGAIGGQGLFTKEIQRALLAGEVDLAVGSLKDLPTDPIEGLVIAATPLRESVHDALISRDGKTLAELPPGARVGTGSIRRRAQLWHARPDLKMEDIRGNVDTRLRKLDEGQYDAIVLAEAGLRRLGWRERVTEILQLPQMLPAVGQGALGLETRSDDSAVRRAVAPLNDPATYAAVTAERALLRALRAGCLAPVAAWGRLEGEDRLLLDAVVLSGDGATRLAAQGSDSPQAAAALGERVAQDLLRQGAAELIAAARTAM